MTEKILNRFRVYFAKVEDAHKGKKKKSKLQSEICTFSKECFEDFNI